MLSTICELTISNALAICESTNGTSNSAWASIALLTMSGTSPRQATLSGRMPGQDVYLAEPLAKRQ